MVSGFAVLLAVDDVDVFWLEVDESLPVATCDVADWSLELLLSA
ncbi:hypothetical protein LZ3411_0343 [Levilactobacillus zymae]|uniref:Uncharacterized protein n=1 Tax=Levilactobacillus zymae TaxID=267363 RepID=A0A1Y6JX24_9LACO|nr:hypothetical protein LZ3411_0343 [Levilactobacillus zymae]